MGKHVLMMRHHPHLAHHHLNMKFPFLLLGKMSSGPSFGLELEDLVTEGCV